MARPRYQSGCLFKRGKRKQVWVGRWREDLIQADGKVGKVQRSAVLGSVSDFPTRSDARQLLDALLRPLNQGSRKPEATTSFGDFSRKWEEAVLPIYRPSTRYFYWKTLHKHVLPRFTGERLCDIRTAEVQTFLNQKAKRYSPSVLYHIRATLGRILTSAKEWGYVESNPVEGVRLPHKQNVRPSIAFSFKDVRRILTKLREPYKSMVVVAGLTGMRASELFALRWEDIDFKRGLLHVRQTFYRGHFNPPKNKQSERAIPMGHALAVVLKKHRRRMKPTAQGLVFSNAVGKAYEPGNLVRRVLWPVLKVLKLPRTGWRAFRRSVATTLSELREPVRTAQQVLGHSSPHTTLAFYTQSFVESQRRAVGKLEKLMFPIVPKFGSRTQLSR